MYKVRKKPEDIVRKLISDRDSDIEIKESLKDCLNNLSEEEREAVFKEYLDCEESKIPRMWQAYKDVEKYYEVDNIFKFMYETNSINECLYLAEDYEGIYWSEALLRFGNLSKKDQVKALVKSLWTDASTSSLF